WRERRALRHRDDPDEAWRCCAVWQRTLINKWNAREWAARHGCRLPRLLYRGDRLDEATVGALPADFVIRPVIGHSRNGVFVMAGGRNLLSDASLSAAELCARVQASQPRGR